jgi:periplasmic copper chaperone A
VHETYGSSRGELVRRIAIVFAAAGIALVAAAAPAWAHVKVEPESAPKGSDAVLAFVVPNEKDDATTNKVVVQFPTDHPIAEAQTEAIPGWTAEVATSKVTTPISTDNGEVNVAVKSVTWTATGAGIAAENFQEFRISVGLPGDADSLTFPTTQTYSDGSTVNWVQVTPPGGPEPDDPAPVLTLTAGEPDGGDTTPTTAAPTGNTAAASDVKKSDVDNAKTIAIIGIVVGALGLVAGIGGLALSRRKSA